VEEQERKGYGGIRKRRRRRKNKNEKNRMS
jgi:hypothetical protein